MRSIMFVLVLMFSLLAGCTDQEMAKSYGGSAQVTLPAGQKLVVATWKEDNLWYLTRPMREGEKPETYLFKENSSWGLMEGTVTFIEWNKKQP